MANQPPPAAGPRGASAPAVSHAKPIRWTPTRITLADELWGEGFIGPGGAEEVLRLATPLGLSEASSMLLLGAATGGAVQAITKTLGAWVSGYEADPALTTVGAFRVLRAGKLAKRMSVTDWDPKAPAFRKRAFHHALALEALRGAPGSPVPVADLLLALSGALRPGGHLVLVDVLATDKLDPADPEVTAWAHVEGRVAKMPTEPSLVSALTKLGFDVRVAEDLSSLHMRLALQGWKRLLKTLKETRPDMARAAVVVAEAEVWMRRLRLMHAGQVRLVRLHAIGKG